MSINLTELPKPDVIEQLSIKTLFNEYLTALAQHDEELANRIVVGDPLYNTFSALAYREFILRQQFNDRAHALMLAFAAGSDLDNLAALFNVERQLVTPADPKAIPPTPPIYEDDERYRKRILLKLESISTAGPEQSYIFLGLSASPKVQDISASSPSGSVIDITVLSTENNGIPDAALLTTVNNALSDKTKRPLGDRVTVNAATIIPYTINAELIILSGPDSDIVKQTAINAVQTYVDENFKLGRDISLSGIMAALHQEGVERVDLTSPDFTIQDFIAVSNTEAAFCNAITVTVN